MLTTLQKNLLGVGISDTTVSVLPGGARIGNVFMNYSGGQTQFSDITDFGGDSSKYQNSALFLQNIGGASDLTSSVSVPKATLRELELPVLPSDSSNPYAPVHSLGLFTFFSSDGTSIELESSSF